LGGLCGLLICCWIARNFEAKAIRACLRWADKQIGRPLGLTHSTAAESVYYGCTQLSIIFDVGMTLSLIIIYPS